MATKLQKGAAFVAASPILLPIFCVRVIDQGIVQPARKRAAKARAAKAERQRLADEREAQYQAELAEMELRWQQHIAKLEDFDRRVNILLTLSCPEGYVACVSKNFDGFISTWFYRITSNGEYIRTRKSDTATVIFDTVDEMKADLDRYLAMSFSLDIPS